MWMIAAAALAAQTTFEANPGAASNRYEVGWTDADRHAERAAFALPAAAVAADRAEPRFPQLEEMMHAEATAVRGWAGRELHGIDVEVTVHGASLSYEVSGRNRDRMNGVLDRAQQVADDAGDRWLDDNFETRTADGSISMDHARIAAQYADDVAPIARALGAEADGRAWAERALGYVQSIPYEARGNGGDKGFRWPLALVDRNRGDCDGKSTLFLALLANAHPEIASAVVYVPNHALVALELPPAKGDATVKIDGETWVLAEPVGPAVVPIGVVDKGHERQAKHGEIRRLAATEPVSPRPRGGRTGG